ncbi:hypothetical protein FB45DRAFT_839272 [Roridomyces roridus]|uniref:F-box domain-containing protein n=1 Tax=Roridomyces roridus TaxID=1738132 RepID=A0AAD7BI18_9AGAR|nr:hypothetical protein FB45DRAFT_839272 [Roridomyces roridus]
MSANSLPDEIISEILSPALKVPDKKFSSMSGKSPFTAYSESPSVYLLVCKSWLRVATPLLYNVVVLRSKAQAKALALTLSKNKDFGRFIRYLRVEGGYGAPLRTILQSSPDVTDLFIDLDIWSSDNPCGLCAGLGMINPTRLILWEPRSAGRTENKMATKLLDALIKAIPQWDRLPCDTSNKSPFSEYLESPSAYLLVCKSWLRVATCYTTPLSSAQKRRQRPSLRSFPRTANLGSLSNTYASRADLARQCAPF